MSSRRPEACSTSLPAFLARGSSQERRSWRSFRDPVAAGGGSSRFRGAAMGFETTGDRARPSAGLGADGRHDELLRLARAHYAERRKRSRHLPERIFGEPSWDLLLDLFIALREGKEVCTSSACLAAHVPQTTALRRLQLLEHEGLIERAGDPADHRRTIIRLTVEGNLAMTRHFAAIAAARPCDCG